MRLLKQIQPLFFVGVSLWHFGCGSTPSVSSTKNEVQATIKEEKSTQGYDLNQDEQEDMWRVTVKKGSLTYLGQKSFDFNFDGKVDFKRFFTPEGQIQRDESDLDFDGIDDVVIYYQDSLISKKEIHLQGPKKVDVFEYYQQGQLTCVEIDEDADGLLDRWERYNDDKKKEEGPWTLEFACQGNAKIAQSQ
jgi:hypothetical protein